MCLFLSGACLKKLAFILDWQVILPSLFVMLLQFFPEHEKCTVLQISISNTLNAPNAGD